MRAALLAVACGCAGSSPAASTTTTPSPPAATTAACTEAYAAYERDWRTALTEDLSSSGALDATDVQAIVDRQVDTLPKRHELEELRDINKLIEIFLWDAAWPVAFTSADRAIGACGEGTARPH